MRTITTTLLSTALAATVTLLAAPAANAALVRVIYTTATNACQPATPLELGGLRFRPLGIYNNKPIGIYISCSLDTEIVGDITNDVWVRFDNQGTSTQQVNCTFQGGSRQQGVNNYPVSVSIDPGVNAWVLKDDIDKVEFVFTTLNISCLLPPKMEMGLIRLRQEDTGDGL